MRLVLENLREKNAGVFDEELYKRNLGKSGIKTLERDWNFKIIFGFYPIREEILFIGLSAAGNYIFLNLSI